MKLCIDISTTSFSDSEIYAGNAVAAMIINMYNHVFLSILRCKVRAGGDAGSPLDIHSQNKFIPLLNFAKSSPGSPGIVE